MAFSRILLLILLILVATIAMPIFGARLLNVRLGADVSGWVQAGIALISFPIILYELDQLRQAAYRKPRLEIGIVNIRDLPFSKVRELAILPSQTTVSTGYPHFYIILRNTGSAAARFVKIYLEHVEWKTDPAPPPHVKVSEFSEDKPSFVHEHNFDFVFRAGTEWIINPNDIEPFGFHLTTSVITEKTNSAGVKYEVPIFAPRSEVILDCTVWADGLRQPLRQRLSITAVEHQERDFDG